jgi:hypothetical protein
MVIATAMAMTASATNSLKAISAVSLILFMCAIIVGVFALTMALALWLGELICSATMAWVIVGAIFIVVAVIIYFVSLHKTIRRINRRLDTVYEVSATIEALYRQIVSLIQRFISSWK